MTGTIPTSAARTPLPLLIAVATLSLFWPSAVGAQTPTRKIEGELAGSYFFGNTRQTVASTRAQYERRDSIFAVRILGRFNYGELTDEVEGTSVSKRSWQVAANYDFHPFADFSPFLETMMESSLENRIDHRMSAGAGTRYNVVRDSATDVILSIGAVGERTYPLTPAGATPGPATTLARGSAALRLRRELSETVTVTSESVYEPALLEPSDYTIVSQSSVQVKLARFAALTLTVRDSYDNMAVRRGARVNNNGELLVGLLTTF